MTENQNNPQIVGSKNTKQHKLDSQNRWEQEYQTV
jgi:hypothetical protein